MTPSDSIIIAIDGYSSCGKSTLARDLARVLEYVYVDTGAMYRAVTLYFMRQQLDWTQAEQVRTALAHIQIDFVRQADQIHTLLNGEDVEDAIRSMEVSDHVSSVAAISSVRRFLVAQQQRMGQAKGIVMDGRDIGTVVFPDAELKIFLTASQKERTRRRYAELVARGEHTTWEVVEQNLMKRDQIDSSRPDSPLRQADDAVVIDNTNLKPNEQLAMVAALARERGA
ncbi:MAG: (d)CMP kinase [Bacteroidetes bacterium]|nr:MAG: (d)CMP kinase [Bacteroidota bacterium]